MECPSLLSTCHHSFQVSSYILSVPLVVLALGTLLNGNCCKRVRVYLQTPRTLALTNVSSWCTSKRLQLNAKKTELLWFGSMVNLHNVSHADRCLTIGSEPVEIVHVIGVYFDTHMTTKAHIARVSRTCFYHLLRLRSIRG